MRALTNAEVERLTVCLGSVSVEYPIEDPILDRMAKRGYFTRVEDPDWVNHDITPKGELALRVHRAYLASLGATS